METKLKVVKSIGLLAFCACWLQASAPDTLWTRAYGGNGDDRGYSVKQTTDGGYIVTGYTKSFGNGRQLYLLRTDGNGDTIWTRNYGGNGDEEGSSVQEISGGYIAVGYTASFGAGNKDLYIIKTGTNGDTVWTRFYGGAAEDRGRCIQITSGGGFIVSGYTKSFGAGNFDFYLVNTDGNGDTIWTKTHGGGDEDRGYYVKEDLADRAVRYISTGYTKSFGAGGFDVYLVKSDENGDTLWTRTYGGIQDDRGSAVQLTSDGGYIVTGYTKSFGNGREVYLVKTDANGDTMWTRIYGGAGDDEGYAVKQTTDGGYIITGYTKSFGAGKADVYIIKTDALGDTTWTKTIGGGDDDMGYSVQQTSDGGYIIGGYTKSFGPGGHNVYLIKLEPGGIGVTDKIEPVTDVIQRLYPNPSTGKVIIALNPLLSDNTPIRIFDATGKLINSIPNRRSQTATWNGLDMRNEPVADGIYFIIVESAGYTATAKLILIK